MFERVRIGSNLNYLIRCLKAGGIDRFNMRVERVFGPFLKDAAKNMRRHHLTTDQATMMLIYATIAWLFDSGELDNVRERGDYSLESLAALYIMVDKFVADNPVRFWSGPRPIDPSLDSFMKSVAPNA